MTRINKLVLHGFKSFAKRTELVFGEHFNCVLGPNGSGKCVTGDTLIYLPDGRMTPIGPLVEQQLAKNRQALDDGYVSTGDGQKILSLNLETLQLEQREIEAYVKRKAPETLLRIQTRSGKAVTTTPYHPLFILRDGKVIQAKAEELSVGTRIAIPRDIRIEPETRYFTELLDAITVQDKVYVCWNAELVAHIRQRKGKRTWKALAREANIPHPTLKGLLDTQSMNFAYVVRLLRALGTETPVMMQLVQRIKAKNAKPSIPMLWENSSAFARFFGYVLAEGRSAPDIGHVWFTNGTEEIVRDYIGLVQQLFGMHTLIGEYKPNCWDVICSSTVLQVLLTKMGMPKGGGTAAKDVTDIFLRHAGEEEIAALLNGLYSGDGYVSANSIEITTKSRALKEKVVSLLLRLGLLSQTREVWKVATNSGFSGKYFTISVYGHEQRMRFAQAVPLIHPAKRAALGQERKRTNPNVDLIAANQLVKEAVQMAKVNVKSTKRTFPRLDAYCYNQCVPSRAGLQLLLSEVLQARGGIAEAQLQKLAYANIFWDEIAEIEQIPPPEPWVYDLCVAEQHNFVANGIYVHNSNIMDALCFVLGKSSAKALRTEKAANLIYNGGKSKKPAKDAEVSIFFDNKEKTFPTDAPEVKITRIVRESGQSIYKINDEKRTREQVLELLSLAKVNPDGYNIILQGDIVQFVEMSPEERRLLVEEISGISIYEDKKQKAVNELTKVEEHLKEAEIVMKERETHLSELRKERDQAIKFKDLRDNIQRYKGSLLWKQMRSKEEERDGLAAKFAKAQESLQKKQEEIRAAKELIAQKRAAIEQINKDIEQKGEKEQVAMHKEVEKIRVELATAKLRIDSLKQEMEKIKTRKQQLQQTLADVEGKITKMQAEQDGLRDAIARAEQQQAEIDGRISAFKKKNKLEDAQDIDKQIDALDKQAEEQQKAIQTMRQQQQELLREKDKLEFQINAADEKIAKVLAVEEEHKDAIAALKQQKVEFKKATLELNQNITNDSQLAAQLQNARKTLLVLHEELAKMKARNASILEAHAGDAALRKVLELRKKNPAIHGTVAELGNVGGKYALALEVAAGSRIKSVVVQDDRTAAELIQYLREQKLGVVTFLPLNKIKPVPRQTEVDKIAKANGAHGYAVDLVEYDPKFKNVFSYVFGNTVVVENLDVARRIGVGNAKMATLDGDLTELSGAMQGGFRPKAKGAGFAERELTTEIEQRERKTADTEQLIVRLEKDKQQNEEQIARLRALKANLEGEIIKTEKSLNLQEGDIDVSKKEKQELQKTLKDAERKGEAIIQQITEANQELANNRIERQELRNKITELRNPALIAELNAFEQKKKELREECIKHETEVKGIAGQIQNILAPERENIAKVMKQHSKEEEDFQAELKQLKERIAAMERDLKEKEKQEKQFYEQFKDLFTQRTKLDEECKKQEGKVEQIQEQERSADHAANTAQLELAQVKAAIAGLQQAFEEFREIEVIKNKSEAELRKDIGTAEGVITRMGSINMKALEIYEGVEREYQELLRKKEKLLLEKEDVLVMMNEIELKKKDLFLKTFDVVNHNFKTIFTMLSTKGEADLVLENPEVPFAGGLLIKVKLSGTKFMDIRSLSGGEKTMTALAFIFAIQEHEPASFYVLDEVDAALDKHNSEKLGLLIKKYAEKAQYLMISHNDSIITAADLLYGVSMDEHGMSNVVTLKI